jgi:hypothetical protein
VDPWDFGDDKPKEAEGKTKVGFYLITMFSLSCDYQSRGNDDTKKGQSEERNGSKQRKARAEKNSYAMALHKLFVKIIY